MNKGFNDEPLLNITIDVPEIYGSVDKDITNIRDMGVTYGNNVFLNIIVFKKV